MSPDFQKCAYVQNVVCDVVECVLLFKMLILCLTQVLFRLMCILYNTHTHTHTHTQHMYTSLLYTYINVCTYMHPLYSGSGYGPGECVCARPSVRACVLLICGKNKLGMHFGFVIF